LRSTRVITRALARSSNRGWNSLATQDFGINLSQRWLVGRQNLAQAQTCDA
jgi:hypothetical protein